MRNIKFRGWHAGRKKMFPILSFDPYEVIEATPDLESRYGEWPRGEVKVMQSTGLKDKNGREIYEGDITDNGIVAWFDDLTWDGGGSAHPGFYFVTQYTRDGELQYHDSFDHVEVVGNIYENPMCICWRDKNLRCPIHGDPTMRWTRE